MDWNDEVRKRAEEIWLKQGKPTGRDLENWLTAEGEVLPKKDLVEAIRLDLEIANADDATLPISTNALIGTLKKANEEEILGIIQVLEIDATAVNSVRSQNLINSSIRGWNLIDRLVQDSPKKSYLWMLHETTSALNIRQEGFNILALQLIDDPTNKDIPHSEKQKQIFDAIKKTEIAIVNEIMKKQYEKLSPEKQKEFDEKVQALATQNGKSYGGVGVVGLTMLAGELGGFGTFILMSKLLSTLSLGMLPMGAYLAGSSILGTLLGPVGWILFGLFALSALGETTKKEFISIVASIAMIRLRSENTE